MNGDRQDPPLTCMHDRRRMAEDDMSPVVSLCCPLQVLLQEGRKEFTGWRSGLGDGWLRWLDFTGEACGPSPLPPPAHGVAVRERVLPQVEPIPYASVVGYLGRQEQKAWSSASRTDLVASTFLFPPSSPSSFPIPPSPSFFFPPLHLLQLQERSPAARKNSASQHLAVCRIKQHASATYPWNECALGWGGEREQVHAVCRARRNANAKWTR
ncbi:uncharacterized protein BKA78DRAFT_308913 [Phyllosticta capitalensis]|uniref:uncharacterized protein n=1 Tax=Phyllosticta capitalensis TaxID=121624 RepID=UPI003130A07D